jgi:hypothetical protein
MECVRLRIKDPDFSRKRIHVLGEGDKWRSTILAEPIIPELRGHIERVKARHHRDLEEGFGEVYLPAALAKNAKMPPPRLGGNTSFHQRNVPSTLGQDANVGITC